MLAHNKLAMTLPDAPEIWGRRSGTQTLWDVLRGVVVEVPRVWILYFWGFRVVYGQLLLKMT
jgi:hypothetical protein